MNREYLYKGKRTSNGDWVEGYYASITLTGSAYILTGEIEVEPCKKGIVQFKCYEVQPETVCQYTGLEDKNGRKIFDGDILSFSAYGENFKGDARFIKGNFTIWCGKCAPFLDDALEKHSATVIGNIFDNPELLRGA